MDIIFSRHARRQMRWRKITETEIMKIEYDKEVDALYIRIEETEIAKTNEIEEGINLDFSADGKLVGVEILNARERYKAKDLFSINTEALVLLDW